MLSLTRERERERDTILSDTALSSLPHSVPHAVASAAGAVQPAVVANGVLCNLNQLVKNSSSLLIQLVFAPYAGFYWSGFKVLTGNTKCFLSNTLKALVVCKMNFSNEF